MVQQAVPAVAVHTFEGLIAAEICTAESGCVLTQVALVLKIEADGSWFAHYHDPSDPMRNAQLSGSCPCEIQVIAGMLQTLASLAPGQP